MKIGVVVPTRNNRPEFLERCKFYLSRQTRQPDEVLFVDYPQKIFPVDLTERYKFGLEALRDKVGLIFLIEDDDYYDQYYIEAMLELWSTNSFPDLIGIAETNYYHIFEKAVWRKEHINVSCAFTTAIKAEAVDKINWGTMNKLYFDMTLWKQEDLIKVSSKQLIWIPAVGIKHGIGHCGGAGHNGWYYTVAKRNGGGVFQDLNYEWLKKTMGESDAQWYIDFANKTRMEQGSEKEKSTS